MAMGWIAGGTAVLNFLGQRSANNAANRRAGEANALASENMKMQAEELRKNREFQKEQVAKLDKQKDIYRGMEFVNPYAENIFEDLTINQQQAQFQTQQGQQQRANIMQQMKGSAGGSGVAGLAQMLANQGQLQTQQISASIGQQESQNQKLAAQGKMQVQAGEAGLQEMEMSRQATLLGIQMGQTSGANTAYQQSMANQMSANASAANMLGQQASSLYEQAGQYGSNISDTLGSYATYQASLQ